ncbi:ABC transporter substrate-binding protein [Streptomyces cahuitamycinicus]|uniref:ABC transporter substrate-binding protein n=1 Tax=Streptomyces cahuitamycinicus TaxID=2070367 RepID=UPI0015E06F02|nr:ABC transporter substrate-binding protein [Streptomyces cahuitamycinicus]
MRGTPDDGPAGAAPRGSGTSGLLTVDLDDWPLSLDPYHVVDFNQALVLDTLVDPLTREDGSDAAPRAVPAALESLECLDDGHTWRMRPSPDQTWDDGMPVLLADIQAGVHRAWSPTAFVLPDTVGGPSTTPTQDADGPVLELRSPIPLPFLPDLLAFPGAAPVRETKNGGWTASGPYRPVRADRDQGRIELRGKPSRRSRCHPDAPERIVFQVHTDRADAVAAFDAGELDVCFSTGLDPAAFAVLAGRPEATVRPLPVACRLWVKPGIDSPLDTPEGRIEFSAGWDRGAVSDLLSGVVLPLHGYGRLWPGAPDADRPAPYQRRARPLRATRGACAELALTYADFPPNDTVARALARDIEDRFGHRVRLRPLTFPAFAAAVAAVDYELLYCISPAPFAHPASLLNPFHSATRSARTLGFRDRAVDAALERALRMPAGDGTAEAWRDAEETVLERAPVIPLFQVNSVTLRRAALPAPSITSSGLVSLERMTEGPPPPTAPTPTERRAVYP